MAAPAGIAIFGATSAIAQAVARLYAAEGARFFLAGRNADHLHAIADDLRVRGAPDVHVEVADFRSPESCASLCQAAARALGLPRFMLETDAPYLTPMPHRGKPNEPAFVRHTAEFAAAEVFGVSYEELARVSSANARRFFDF
jgi:NAD(P)-dependent dehydrogenase (short-subunit alcohol dehydrogenase family)